VRPRELFFNLKEHNVDFVLIGGMAAVARGSAQVTVDIDIAYSREKKNLQKLATALAPFNPKLREVKEKIPFKLNEESLIRGLHFTLTTSVGDLDLIGEVPGLGNYEKVLNYAEPLTIFGNQILVLSIDGLIRSKSALNRPKDRNAIEELKAIKSRQSQ